MRKGGGYAVNNAESETFMDAAGLEFSALCNKIVADGRDPDMVAYGMKQSLSRRLRELRLLWESRLTANDQVDAPSGARSAE